jgi:hypothetical protein
MAGRGFAPFLKSLKKDNGDTESEAQSSLTGASGFSAIRGRGRGLLISSKPTLPIPAQIKEPESQQIEEPAPEPEASHPNPFEAAPEPPKYIVPPPSTIFSDSTAQGGDSLIRGRGRGLFANRAVKLPFELAESSIATSMGSKSDQVESDDKLVLKKESSFGSGGIIAGRGFSGPSGGKGTSGRGSSGKITTVVLNEDLNRQFSFYQVP